MEPYIHKATGRRYIQPRGRRGPVPYARWLWEQHFGPIEGDGEVHHINGDRLDDRISNLALLSPEEHKRAHADMVRTCVCAQCGLVFEYAEWGWVRKFCDGCAAERRRESNRRADARRSRKLATCKQCGAEFLTRSGTLCSQRCVNLWTHRNGLRPQRRE